MEVKTTTAKQKIIENAGQNMRIRMIQTAGNKVEIIYLDGMCDDCSIADFVIGAVARVCRENIINIEQIMSKVVFGVGVKERNTYDQMLGDYLNGHALLFCGDDNRCVSVDTRTHTGRSITQPPTSNVTKGPREGFVENLKMNLTMIRKRIKSPDLKIVDLNVGKYTNTAVSVCYIDSIASQTSVDKVIQKIKAINIDGIIDSSYVSRFLDEANSSLFKMIGSAEKPDIVVGKLLEGRIAVIVDGSPIVLTLPYMLVEDLQSPEDYYESPEVTTLSRYLRLFSAIASLLLPSLYVSLQLYNYQIIPAKFLITILGATQAIPFTPLVEMILVLIIFDILREANARMPNIAGLALSIVGAVVLGDAAVRGGLLGAPAVMIGALSGIGLYTMPDNTLLLTLLRLVLTFIGGIMGLYGITLGVLLLISYLASLESYGTPYLAPFAPNVVTDRKDALTKKPLIELKERPLSIKQKNKTRQG